MEHSLIKAEVSLEDFLEHHMVLVQLHLTIISHLLICSRAFQISTEWRLLQAAVRHSGSQDSLAIVLALF